MRRSRTVLPALVLFAAAACGGSKPTAPTIAAPSASDVDKPEAKPAVLTGKLVGHDGKPMKMAHVTVGQEKLQVGADGSFEAVLPTSGFQRVMFTGVDHGDYSIGLLLDGKPVHVEVQLGTYPRPDSFDGAQVVEVLFNDDGTVALGKTHPMTQSDDGLLVADIDTNAAEVAYEVRGITAERGRSMNGTDATPYKYDGDGNYANVVKPEGGKLTISVDPSRMLPAGVPTKVEFRDAKGTVARVSAVYEGMAEDSPEMAPDKLYERVESEQDATVRGALMIAYFAALPSPKPPDEYEEEDVDLAKRAIAELSSESPLWGIEPGSAIRVAEVAGNEEAHREYVEEVISALADDEQAASTLFGMMWRARSDSREEDVERYYGLMKDRYAETRYARLADMFDPNRAIRPGKDVPAFDLVSLDDGKTRFTKDMFQGKTVLIDFWATWCGPCVEEMPNLHGAFHKYKDKGFTILSVNVDDSADNARKFRNHPDHPMPWNNVALEGDAAKPVKEKFEVAALPTVMLMGPDGKVLATGTQLRGDGLETTLAKVLK